MDKKQFKELFAATATQHGFNTAFGGWYIKSKDCILTLSLQASNYSNSYYLNINLAIQGLWGRQYSVDKKTIKGPSSIFRRQPEEYNSIFKLDNDIADERRREGVKDLFEGFIDLIKNLALTPVGVMQLSDTGLLVVLPAVSDEIRRVYLT
jgi:hypothetical protein